MREGVRACVSVCRKAAAVASQAAAHTEANIRQSSQLRLGHRDLLITALTLFLPPSSSLTHTYMYVI
jgi:hypothetical protein